MAHLALAARHVEQGKAIVERQRELVSRLAADGHDFANAEVLLDRFTETLSSHVADRDRLRELLEHDPKRLKKKAGSWHSFGR